MKAWLLLIMHNFHQNEKSKKIIEHFLTELQNIKV